MDSCRGYCPCAICYYADKNWPSFGAKNAYWKEAANYINQSLNSTVSRSGDTIVTT